MPQPSGSTPAPRAPKIPHLADGADGQAPVDAGEHDAKGEVGRPFPQFVAFSMANGTDAISNAATTTRRTMPMSWLVAAPCAHMPATRSQWLSAARGAAQIERTAATANLPTPAAILSPACW